MTDFKLSVNENNKATEFPLWRCCGTARQNPHIRAFWAATISFFLAFLGWFAMAPLGLEVAQSMHVCENQVYPPNLYPKRKAYVTYKDLKTEKSYCKYGKNSDKTDCKPPPTSPNATTTNATTGVDDRYQPSVITGCVCTAGTECAKTLNDGGILSVTSTIVMRIAMGSMLEKLGPVNVQCGLLAFGAIWVAAAAGINAPWNYNLIRFFIGCVGATFVTTQFWCSLMFAPNIVGTVNATAGGWGNLGGGFTHIFMTNILLESFMDDGMSEDSAWRVAMLVPAGLFLVCAVFVKLLCWDTPTRRRYSAAEMGKKKGLSVWDYVEALKDIRVMIMVFQYGACFGTELTMTNMLQTHFRTYFQMKNGDASALASAFGLVNVFARPGGGMVSDFLFAKMGFRGRIWVHFIVLFCEAVFLFAFGSVDNTQPWYVALAVLICFAIFCNAACGTSYAIVPFMNTKQLAVVSALVGAGGNLGSVIQSFCIYRQITTDTLLPFKIHAAYVMFWALMSVGLWWPEHGGMFVRARVVKQLEGEGQQAAEVDGVEPEAVDARSKEPLGDVEHRQVPS